ncbi:hypothetical protein ABFA07_010886 [Porites harrisoni]
MLNDPVVFKEWPHYEDLTAKHQPETATKTERQIPDAVCLEECQKQLRSLYETSSKVKIIPWDKNFAVDIDEIYTDLSWVKDHRRPSGVTQKKLRHMWQMEKGDCVSDGRASGSNDWRSCGATSGRNFKGANMLIKWTTTLKKNHLPCLLTTMRKGPVKITLMQ